MPFVIHARARATVLAVVLAIAVTVPAGEATARRAARVTPRVTVDGRWIPPTRVEGNTVVLVVTVPDGRRVELRYPRRMRLAQGGFATIGVIEWSVRPDPLRCCGRVLRIERTTVDATYGDAIPIAQYRGARDRTVSYFHAEQAVTGGLTTLDYLVFEFGRWMVSAYNHAPGDYEDEMTGAELATWARSLDGIVDERGYLVLRAKAPLSVEPLIDFSFGSPDEGHNHVEIADQYCGTPESDTEVRRELPGGVAWCDRDTGLHVSATGSPGFVRAAARSLEVRLVPDGPGTS